MKIKQEACSWQRVQQAQRPGSGHKFRVLGEQQGGQCDQSRRRERGTEREVRVGKLEGLGHTRVLGMAWVWVQGH